MADALGWYGNVQPLKGCNNNDSNCCAANCKSLAGFVVDIVRVGSHFYRLQVKQNICMTG